MIQEVYLEPRAGRTIFALEGLRELIFHRPLSLNVDRGSATATVGTRREEGVEILSYRADSRMRDANAGDPDKPTTGTFEYPRTNLANPDFSEVARVMGAEGYRVEHEDEVSDALKAALRTGKPSVVEILLTQELGEPFRRDAFRQPRRLLPKYRRYNAKESR